MIIRLNGIASLLGRASSKLQQPRRNIQVKARRVMVRGQYREPDLDLKELLVATLPYIEADMRPAYERCTSVGFDVGTTDPVHPYNVIEARELIDRWNSVPLVAIFQRNFINDSDYLEAHNEFFKSGMKLVTYNHFVYQYAFEGTHLESLLPLVRLSRNVPLLNTSLLFCGSTETNINGEVRADPSSDLNYPLTMRRIQKINRDYPEFVLLAGVLRNSRIADAQERILSRREFLALRSLPSLDMARASLCHTLTIGTSALGRSLNYGSAGLSRSLEHLSKNIADDKSRESRE